MKKRCTCFLRMQWMTGAALIATACLSAAGTLQAADPAPAAKAAAPAAAKSKAVKAPAKAAAPAAPVKKVHPQTVQRSREAELILEKISKAKKLFEDGKDIREVLAALDDSDAAVNAKMVTVNGKKEHLPYMAEIAAKAAASRKEITQRAAEGMLADANKLYTQGRNKGASPDGAELAGQAQKMAKEARFLYYLGVGSEKADAAMLDNEINSGNIDFSIRVEKLAVSCDKLIKAADFRTNTSLETVDGAHKDRQREISALYTKAQKLYRNKQYTMARDLCESIFVMDPYNQNAIRLLEKIYRQMYFYSELRSYNEMLRNDAETVWSWVPGSAKTTKNIVKTTSRQFSDPLMEKISNLIISVDFKDYTITDAINKIRDLSKEADPSHTGVNFLPSNLPQDSSITLELDNVPLNVVLDYLCKKAKISWTTDRETFVQIGTGIGDYENLEIPMRNSVYARIATESSDGEEDSDSGSSESMWGAGGVGSTGVAGGVTQKGKRSDTVLKQFFKERGIPFDDPETFVAYDATTHQLSARNTRENLLKLETLVREMDVENPLVLVEAKILEIGMNDQEALGFDWTVDYTNDKNSEYDFTMESPLRDLAQGDGSGFKLINNLNIVPNLNLNGGHQFNVYLTVTAVDRTDRVEILSTPKVISKSGEEANIKMVRQMYFPESWAEPDTSNICGTSLQFEPSYPEFGDPQDVGISFTVMPTVSSNNKVVTLQLLPSVTDLVGWTEYPYEVIIQQGSSNTEDGVYASNARAVMDTPMPEISNREIQTTLKIFDGQTVLIGGLTVDKQVSSEDKYPILGDIPIIGRLFTQKSDLTERSNLLISVTPRLISGDGIPINTNVATGIPDFRR